MEKKLHEPLGGEEEEDRREVGRRQEDKEPTKIGLMCLIFFAHRAVLCGKLTVSSAHKSSWLTGLGNVKSIMCTEMFMVTTVLLAHA
jgi:hypothetical protein